MTRTGTGLTTPTQQHSQSPSNYQTGHCEVGGHSRCLGVYAGTGCTCPCHTAAPPPLRPQVATVHCFFGCPAVVASADPDAAHAAMESHYFEAHRPDIRAAVGWMTGGAA